MKSNGKNKIPFHTQIIKSTLKIPFTYPLLMQSHVKIVYRGASIKIKLLQKYHLFAFEGHYNGHNLPHGERNANKLKVVP